MDNVESGLIEFYNWLEKYLKSIYKAYENFFESYLEFIIKTFNKIKEHLFAK